MGWEENEKCELSECDVDKGEGEGEGERVNMVCGSERLDGHGRSDGARGFKGGYL